jgi:hypothetical protein
MLRHKRRQTPHDPARALTQAANPSLHQKILDLQRLLQKIATVSAARSPGADRAPRGIDVCPARQSGFHCKQALKLCTNISK